MLNRLPTWGLVTLITILIWVLAEGESVRVVSRSIDVQIRPDPDAPRVIMVEPGQEFRGSITVRLEGSTASLDAIANDLRAPIGLTPEMLNLPAGTGTFTPDLKAALRAHPVFRNRGVTPVETNPESIRVTVDDLVTRDLRVAVTPPEGVLLQGVPEAVPNELSLRLPSRLAAALPADAAIVATPDPAAVSQLPDGRAQTVTAVQLELPESIRNDPLAQFVPLEPGLISVTLTKQSDTDSVRLPTVPVTLRVGPLDLQNLDVQIPQEDRDIIDVTVTGPRDLIAQLQRPNQPEQGRIKVFAVVPLDWQQLEAAAISGEPITRDVVFMLSRETSAAVRFEAADRAVRLTVRRRQPEVSPPG